ncbi:endogenous retrovirus group K member 7 Env polyprotein-like [Rousettus aegyptiacus]|uniref:endogenous retrovirus group K member 7 Env polyprotein-like n=1 Tax=Rousettus aegyptiacus TaxID=9407 RepID=UPI00168D1F7F|nr:endogenous retrovirus group K member 7 Env polyprotein-like [Rousettus aegyptiacus]XP_036079190.1 endogenous retrovirus group K member 7 Env polyprotein-like [Rousettus aegyptiacus]XP_036079191.1 endogenous retrovirus group K member 7 Env polyprotein-like [Rousettus aegyptiacus]
MRSVLKLMLRSWVQPWENYALRGWISRIADTNITACVTPPHVLMIGGINVTMRGRNFYVTCYDCIFTNCISFVLKGTTVMVFHQLSFVMLPVNTSGPWCANRGLQVLEEIYKALSRQKRVIGLIIAGITALVSLIATAAVALSQTVQTAHYVNNLSKNVTMALGTQENIDNKLEQKLDALYSLVMYLGDEIQGLKVRFHLECHAAYQWICVTSKIYNESQHGWDHVCSHLQGVWHDANTSLDLIQLHREIQGLQDAGPLQFDAAEEASKFLQHLKSFLSFWSPLGHLLISALALGLCIIIGGCLLPHLMTYFFNSLLKIGAEMHSLRLQAQV